MKINLLTSSHINLIKNIRNLVPQTIPKKISPKQIPIIEKPLIFYDVHNKALAKLLDMMKDADVKVPNYLEVNPISNSGLSESSKTKVRSSINNAYKKGDIDEETKNKLLSQVNFTGKEKMPNEMADTVTSDLDVGADIDVDNIDVSMCSELKEYFLNPVKTMSEELLDSILDLGEDALDIGEKVFSTIKNFIIELTDAL